MFEIYTFHPPYSTELDTTVRKKFRDRHFPLARIECPTIRSIIERCWMGEYVHVSDVCADLLEAQRAPLHSR
jgi:hypothetical protein